MKCTLFNKLVTWPQWLFSFVMALTKTINTATHKPWRRQKMTTPSPLLWPFLNWNHRLLEISTHKEPAMQTFYVYCDVSLNKRLNGQSRIAHKGLALVSDKTYLRVSENDRHLCRSTCQISKLYDNPTIHLMASIFYEIKATCYQL